MKFPSYVKVEGYSFDDGKASVVVRLKYWAYPVIVYSLIKSGELRMKSFTGWLMLLYKFPSMWIDFHKQIT